MMSSVATVKGPRRTSRPGEEGINCHERSGRESSASDRGWNGHRAVFVVGNPLTSVGTAGHDRPRPPLTVKVTGLATVLGRGGRAVHVFSPHNRSLAPKLFDGKYVDQKMKKCSGPCITH